MRERGAGYIRPGQVEMQWASSGEDDGALNSILKFAYVTGPVVGGELAHRSRRDSHGGTIHSPRALPQEVLHERWDIAAAFTQRRDFNRENTQAIEKVLPEMASVDVLLQVAIARSDDTNIDLARACVADALQFLLLQNPQQLCLHCERHFGDFVKEECATVGQFEAAWLVLERSGERTFT